MYSVQIIHVFRSCMIAKYLVITGNTQDIFYPECRSTQNVRLNRESVSITAGYLHDRFDTVIHDNLTGSHTCHSNCCGLVISEVCRCDGTEH